jgi:AcrR family transcriptional regulator
MSKEALKKRFTDKDIIDSLEASGGLVAEASKLLGLSRRNFYYRFKKKPEKWQQVREDIANRNLDIAESKLMENIKQGKEASIFFYLKCKGKGRGYVEKQEIDMTHSLDARSRTEITSDMTEIEAAQKYMEMIKQDKK